MKSILKSAVFAAMLFGVNILHAQLQLTSADLAAIEATTPLSADQVPVIGTFYSAANPQFPPAPADIFGLPAWDLGSLGGIEIYLLDDLDGASGGGFHAMDDSDPLIPEGGTNDGGGGGYSFTNTYSFPTNGLWMQITNMADNMVFANLNGATDIVYEIYSTTNLAVAAMAVSNWDIETEVFPCQNTNVMPFSVYMDGRPNLFLWARDWTGITSFGNQTPEWWFFYWFGSVDWSDNDMDIFGHSFQSDYNNKQDPNYITFSLQFTNTYYTANSVGAAINVQYGLPFYEAILIDDTNAADAIWVPFDSTNLTLNLSNGLCTVYVGLRGRQPQSQQTWRLAELTLNDTPLTLTVTNPASDTTSQPMIQVQGYASKPLTALTFDVSNAAGFFPNQTGYITSQYCDTNLQMVTTNYFQCYDVRVTNGLNVIVLHAKDTGGETTSTSESLTVDYSANTNPPTLSIIWPPDETVISGTNFNLQAQVNDDTATVTAQIMDENGDTNTVQGLVERSGLVWANNLPLAAGTNFLAVTATDAGGYSTTTNLTVVQSTVNVTVNPLPASELNQSSVTVTGTVSDTNESVYVNGTQATVHADGTWTACMVPVNAIGTATFNVQVYSGDPELDGSQTAIQEQPPTIVLADYQMQTGNSQGGNGQNQNAQWDYVAGGNFGQMYYPSGGGWSIGGQDPDIPPDGSDYTAPLVTSDQGETLAPTWQISNANTTEGNQNLQTSTSTTLMIVPADQTPVGGTAYYYVQLAGNEFSDLENDWNIYGLNLGGANQGDLPDPPEWFEVNGQPLIDMGVTNADGTLPGYAIVSGPAGTPVALTLTSTQYSVNNDQTFPNNDVAVSNLTLQIVDANTGNNLTAQTNTVIVGQQMNLTCQLSITNALLNNSSLSNFQWAVPGMTFSNYEANDSIGILNTNYSTTNSNVAYCWIDSGLMQTKVSASFAGQIMTGQAWFNVVKPTGFVLATTGTIAVDTNFSGTAPEGNFVNAFALHYGNPDGVPGITFSNTIAVPNGFSGSFEWVQVINYVGAGVENSNGVWINSHTIPLVTNVLDSTYPYDTTNEADDSPAQIADQYSDLGITEAFNANMWLMFQPTNGQVVPLKVVNWYMSATAARSGTNWMLTSTNNNVNPSFQDTTTFPIWSNNVQNFDAP